MASTSAPLAPVASGENGEPNKLRIKRFANGDEYQGQWSGGVPDGEGVYTWMDGSSYSGTWQEGLKHGVGKYVWPSGATYTGEWKDGFMHGMGTFSSPDRTFYQGGWAKDRKHGLGKKVYANGDSYEGLWNKGKAEGPGRYRWKDGNEYDGDWKGGRMHGRGTFVWKTGERYDGEWLDGHENGIGIFTWANGSMYDGFWEGGRKHGVGIYWPKEQPGMKRAQRASWTEEDDRQIRSAPVSAMSYVGIASPSALNHDAEPSIPAIPLRELPEETASPTRTQPQTSEDDPEEKSESGEHPLEAPSVTMAAADRGQTPRMSGSFGDAGSVVLREYNRGRLMHEVRVGSQALESMLKVSHRALKKMERKKVLQRPGETIFKGHQSYDLMLNLQQGIRYSIGRYTTVETPAVLPADSCKEKVSVDFPRSGSQTTPPHPSSDFSWKDYAPLTFRKLRDIFEIDASEYMLSLCGDQALRELKTPGKSGSVFYLSQDDRFIIKTMKKEEMVTLLNMLPSYLDHIQKFPNSLLTRFYGIHRISPSKGRKVRFVVMANIMRSDVMIHRTYDLKGSTVGRFTEGPVKPTTVLKDLDLDCTFKLEEGWRGRFVRQMQEDCRFLEKASVMDYSLLLGVHYRDHNEDANGEGDGKASLKAIGELGSHSGSALEASSSRHFSDDATQVGRTNSLTNGRGSTFEDGPQSPDGPQGRAYLARLAEEHGIEEQWVLSVVRLAERRLYLDKASNTDNKASVLARMPKRTTSMRPIAFQPGGSDDIAQAFNQRSVRLGTNIAGTAVPNSGEASEARDAVLLFGIIDILQDYNGTKKIEHAWKSLTNDSNAISAVNPKQYSKRFQSFMKGVFV